jgi:hypothetical protein
VETKLAFSSLSREIMGLVAGDSGELTARGEKKNVMGGGWEMEGRHYWRQQDKSVSIRLYSFF